jgi:hypothetical protein
MKLNLAVDTAFERICKVQLKEWKKGRGRKKRGGKVDRMKVKLEINPSIKIWCTLVRFSE